VAIVIAAILLSVFAIQPEEFARFEKVDLKLDSVNDSHAVVGFIFRVHRSEVFENGSIEVAIYDAATGLLTGERTVKLPDKSSKVEEITVRIPFEKDRDYDVVARLLKDSEVLDYERFSIRNLSTLIPENKDIRVIMRDADFILLGSDAETVRVKARFYVESMKNYSLMFHIKVVQYESNVLAAESWMEKTITKGKTNLVESEFEIPRDYNYLVKLEVWREGSLLKSWGRQLILAPTKVIPEGMKEEKAEFEVEKFIRPVTPSPEEIKYSPAPGGVPGFEILIAVLSIGGVAVWMRKMK
jgi:hypothetical protein